MLSREEISSQEAPQAIGPYAQAVAAGEWVYLSGQIGLDPGTGELVAGGLVAEVERVLDNLEAVLSAAGSGLDRLVQVTVYLTDLGDFSRLNDIYARRLGDARPARITVGVASLPRGARVEMAGLALRS
jgi:2-iminobutanoate/2-iminopropanoate deaminase